MTSSPARVAAPSRRWSPRSGWSSWQATIWPLKFTAYDGSSFRPDDAEVGPRLRHPSRHHLPGDLARGAWDWPVPTSPVTWRCTACILAIPMNCFTRHGRQDRTSSDRPARVLANIVRSIGLEHLQRSPRRRRSASALATHRGGLRHSKYSRCRSDSSPLRRVEHVLRVGAWHVDDLHVRLLPRRRREPGRGAGQQVSAGVREAPTCSRAIVCWTSAAAGAAWCATRRGTA